MITRPFYPALLFISALACCSCAPKQSPPTTPYKNATTTNTDSNKGINWQSCTQSPFTGWLPSYTPAGSLECATIEVPLIPTNNAVDDKTNSQPTQSNPPTTIKLAVSRLPSTGTPAQKIGTLISISGGPGQSGLDVSAVDSAAYQRLSKHFDIIGYAPRGVYPTTPTIKCSTQARVLYPEDVQKFVKGCWQYTPNDLLTQLGADYAVKDIEAIRQALDVPKVNLIGYSYGTKIAALYAEAFPEHLRAGVLDGVVNLNESDIEVSYNQAAQLQQTFERFVTVCRQQFDCYFADTSSVKEAEAKLATLYLYIENNKVYDLDNQRILPESLSWVFYDLLTWPEQWPLLDELLKQIDAKQFELLNVLIDDAKDNIDYATFSAIICADGAPNQAKKATYLSDIRRIDALMTWDDYRTFDDDEILDACYYWPVAGSDVPHVPKLSPSAPPLLLVAQTHDPATPYINALAMQKYLKSVLLTREGDGHTLTLANLSSCVDKKVVDYLIDPNSLKNKQDEDNLYCAR